MRDGEDSDKSIECYLGTTQHTANNVGEPGRQAYDIEKVFKSNKLLTTPRLLVRGGFIVSIM